MMTSLSQNNESSHKQPPPAVKAEDPGSYSTYVFKPLNMEKEYRNNDTLALAHKSVSQNLLAVNHTPNGIDKSKLRRRRSLDAGRYIHRKRMSDARVLSAGANKNVTRPRDTEIRLSMGRSTGSIFSNMGASIRNTLNTISPSTGVCPDDIKLSLISLRSNDETLTSLVSVDTSKRSKG